MKTLSLIFILLITTQAFAEEAFVSVCDRHPAVRDGIVKVTTTRCDELLPRHLARIDNLEVRAKLSGLRASDFKDLDLSRLSLESTDNEVVEFPSDIFKNIPNLRTLSLRNANFDRLPDQTFSQLNNLVNLNIEKCRVGKLGPEFFIRWPHLTSLRVPADSMMNRHYPTFETLVDFGITDGSLDHLSNIFFGSIKRVLFLTLTRVALDGAPYDLFASLQNPEFRLRDTDLKPFAEGRVAWPTKIEFLSIEFVRVSPELPIGLFDQPNLSIRGITLRGNPSIEQIPDNLFIHIDDLEQVHVTGAQLSRTNKSAFAGVPQVIGLPTNFGVTDAGGLSPEWAP